MSNSPTTFANDQHRHEGVAWHDHVTLHHKNDGGGVLYALKAIRRGTLAELVRHVMRLPQQDRAEYVIEKPGDHRLEFAEIERLANRPDFPHE